MNKVVTMINPNLISQIGDSLGSGIPYMPIPLAYLTACLKDKYNLNVIDAFGEVPFKIREKDGFYIQGITISEIKERINKLSDYFIIYYSTIMANIIIKEIISIIKAEFPDKPIIIIENSEAVIGCSLEYIADDLFDYGADYLVFGECEEAVPALLDILNNSNLNNLSIFKNIAYKENRQKNAATINPKFIENIDKLPFPAWEYFPLENYWKLGYSHGPREGKYLAIMTSRGCPFDCNFCVIPATNKRKWRARTPENVVDEMEFMINKFQVCEFHLEDVNPTANEARIIEICKRIIKKKLKIKWKLASGSKIETMKIQTLKFMREAGCNYISFSPESGSDKVLKLMNKPFNHAYAIEMTKKMNKFGIKSQACFVLGFPGEKREDLELTKNYIKKLTKVGVDEIALFIMTPIPGTKTYGKLTGYKDLSQLTFSPKWRHDFENLNKYRKQLYLNFLKWKLLYHPIKVFKQFINLLMKRFESKAEMNIYRMLKLKQLIRRSSNKKGG